MDTWEIERLVREHSRRRAEVVEKACEAALCTGRYGVKVTERVGRDGLSVTAEVSPEVPYGHIYEYRETA
jgi:hypothetical protein